MHRNKKTEEHKRLRKIIKEYDRLSTERFRVGAWVDVEPYQRGWVRDFVLRDDVKNRSDAREFQQALDLINLTVFCRNQDFLHRNWKTGELQPIKQYPKHPTVEQYNAMTEKLQSMFELRRYNDRVYRNGRYEFESVERYTFRWNYYLVFRVQPNIVTQHWIPDNEVHSRFGELKHYIDSNGLWTKFPKALHWNVGYRERFHPNPRYRNADNFEFEDDVE